MLDDPARALSSIDLLDEDEHAYLDAVGNRAALIGTGVAVSIPELFAAQVARTPDAVALVFGGRRGPIGRWSRPPTGWRICWPVTGWAPGMWWRCWCPGVRRPSPRLSGC